jgi:hypothetical protein
MPLAIRGEETQETYRELISNNPGQNFGNVLVEIGKVVIEFMRR